MSDPEIPAGHFQISVALSDGKGEPEIHFVEVYVIDLTDSDLDSWSLCERVFNLDYAKS